MALDDEAEGTMAASLVIFRLKPTLLHRGTAAEAHGAHVGFSQLLDQQFHWCLILAIIIIITSLMPYPNAVVKRPLWSNNAPFPNVSAVAPSEQLSTITDNKHTTR